MNTSASILVLVAVFAVQRTADALPLNGGRLRLEAAEDSSSIKVASEKQEEPPFGGVGNGLLAKLLQQTLYSRMENLLLDPGRKSVEKRRIVESAVENYQNQDMRRSPSLRKDKQRRRDDSENEDQAEREDFTKLAGYWIRETPEPTMMASTSPFGALSGEGGQDFKTESYKITDLFTSSTTTSTTTTTTTQKSPAAEIRS